jgi:hypothetical protein
MADVTYNTDVFPNLVSTILKLYSKVKRTGILMAYKERDEAERVLWDILKENGIELVLIDTVEGSGGAPVEIWYTESVIIQSG